jgi:hypothetical protein
LYHLAYIIKRRKIYLFIDLHLFDGKYYSREVIKMTYRSGRSYVRFPDSRRTVPERSLMSSSARMDQLIQADKRQTHLPDQPAVTETQNAFDAAEMEE